MPLPAEANGRRNRDRTCDPSLVRAVLSQLSYPPTAYSAKLLMCSNYIRNERCTKILRPIYYLPFHRVVNKYDRISGEVLHLH